MLHNFTMELSGKVIGDTGLWQVARDKEASV
jgi:hypothetical protein